MTPPTFQIYFDWDKHIRWPTPPDPTEPTLYYGYARRPTMPLTAIVWHSTEHQRGQTFADVCRYLRESPDVSAHYAVSDTGEIQRILDPGPWMAYHAGYSFYQGRREWNMFAVGVEMYHRAGGPGYTPIQLAAGAWLAQALIHDHPTITQHVKHAWIACNPYDEQPPVIYGRKTDPTDFSDANFRQWVGTFGQA